LSEEPFLPDLEDPGGEALVSGVVMVVFACLVLVLGASWIVVDTENESLRKPVEALRAFALVSLVALWLCRRGLEPEEVVPGGSWGDGGAEEEEGEAVCVLEETEILPCSAAHERTEESESFRCGWRRPSDLCLESLESLDMALAGGRREWR
jgi:hypothetical protein